MLLWVAGGSRCAGVLMLLFLNTTRLSGVAIAALSRADDIPMADELPRCGSAAQLGLGPTQLRARVLI
jgi:hypothetical protein